MDTNQNPTEESKVVTVDGLAGSGKSTVARLLAERLGFAHLNSGLIYRAVAFLVQNAGVPPSEEDKICQLMEHAKIALLKDSRGNTSVELDSQDITMVLQSPEISELASKIASSALVRLRLLSTQREAFPGFGLVAEGRDMGTVVFPGAQVKFFISAPNDTRIARRIKQLGLNAEPDVEARMLKEIGERDRRDSERSVAPTKPADDAIHIDNSSEGLTSLVEGMYQICLSRGIVSSGR